MTDPTEIAEIDPPVPTPRPTRAEARGRRLTLDDEKITTIAESLRAGATWKAAAARCGISEQILHRWRARGRVGLAALDNGDPLDPYEDIFVELVERTEKALGDWEVEAVAAIRKAGMGTDERAGQWQALAWALERRRPQEYGRTLRTEISGPEDGPIQVQTSGGDDPALTALLGALDEAHERLAERAVEDAQKTEPFVDAEAVEVETDEVDA